MSSNNIPNNEIIPELKKIIRKLDWRKTDLTEKEVKALLGEAIPGIPEGQFNNIHIYGATVSAGDDVEEVGHGGTSYTTKILVDGGKRLIFEGTSIRQFLKLDDQAAGYIALATTLEGFARFNPSCYQEGEDDLKNRIQSLDIDFSLDDGHTLVAAFIGGPCPSSLPGYVDEKGNTTIGSQVDGTGHFFT